MAQHTRSLWRLDMALPAAAGISQGRDDRTKAGPMALVQGSMDTWGTNVMSAPSPQT